MHEEPESHGSMRMEKVPGGGCGGWPLVAKCRLRRRGGSG